MKTITLFKTPFDGIKEKMPPTFDLEQMTEDDYKNIDLPGVYTITQFDAQVSDEFDFANSTKDELMELWSNADEKTLIDFDFKKSK